MGDNVVLVGSWDCSDCGHTHIPGTVRICPNCHNPQNSIDTPEEDFYLEQNAPVVTDKHTLEISDLPTKYCGYCGEPNDGDVTKCSNCGKPVDETWTINRRVRYDDMADHHDVKPDPRDEIVRTPREEADDVMRYGVHAPRRMKDLTLHESELPITGRDTEFYDGIRKRVNERAEERERVKQLPLFVQKFYPFRRIIAIGVICAVVMGVILSVVGIVHHVRALTATVPGTVTVSDLHWKRNTEVEQFQSLMEEDWEEDVPADARRISERQKQRSEITVHDGWTTESYTDYVTESHQETYTGYDTEYSQESYSYDCGYTQNNGNGTFTKVSRTCYGTRSVSHQVPVTKTRTVYTQVPVIKTRPKEITHQEPVFDTWATYQVDRWVTERWISASDDTSRELVWPVPTGLVQNNQPGDQVGEERVGDERTETYSAVYIDQQGVNYVQSNMDFAVWSKLVEDGTVPATYRQRTGKLVDVIWPAA